MTIIQCDHCKREMGKERLFIAIQLLDPVIDIDFDPDAKVIHHFDICEKCSVVIAKFIKDPNA